MADHFAETGDTLCYATNENQDATKALIQDGGDVAIVIGGFNSSNTSHLVELCAEVMPTYFVRDAGDLLSDTRIRHFLYHQKSIVETSDWLPAQRPVNIVLTAGASCPDILLDQVIEKLVGWEEDPRPVEQALKPYLANP